MPLYTTKQVDRSKHIERLDSIGERRRRGRELLDDAARDAERDIPAALMDGMSVSEIARRAGYTRKAVYDLLRKLGIEI